MKSWGITRVFTIHPEGDTYMWNKFHGNPFNSWRDISLKTSRRVRWSVKSPGYIIWEPWISVQNLVPIHLVDVELFQIYFQYIFKKYDYAFLSLIPWVDVRLRVFQRQTCILMIHELEIHFKCIVAKLYVLKNCFLHIFIIVYCLSV